MPTNEPVGFTQLTERSFRSKEEGGWLDRGDAAFTIEAVTGPEGDDSVGQAFFEEGFVAGSGPIKTYYPISGRADTAFFLHLRGFRVSADWDGQDDGINKVFFIAHDSSPGIFVQVKGSGAGTLHFRVNTQLPSAVQTRDFELGQSSAGGTDYECVRGTFYDIQVLCEENLVGSEDTGRIRMWVKESAEDEESWVLVADSDLEVPNYDAGAFDGLVMWDDGEGHFFNGEHSWNPTYGGGAGTVGTDQEQQMDYAYISVGEAGAEIGEPAVNPALDIFSNATAIATSATWQHGSQSPGGAVVIVNLPLTGADLVTSVTYGGVVMTRVATAGKTSGEAMRSYLYVLGRGVPAGIVDVVVTCSGVAVIIGYAMTFDTDPGFGIEVVDSDITINSDAIANPSVSLSLGGRDCFCAVALVSGHNAATGVAPLTDWTSKNEAALGSAATTALYTYDITDSDDVTAGWTQTSEDAVAIAFALGQAALPRVARPERVGVLGRLWRGMR